MREPQVIAIVGHGCVLRLLRLRIQQVLVRLVGMRRRLVRLLLLVDLGQVLLGGGRGRSDTIAAPDQLDRLLRGHLLLFDLLRKRAPVSVGLLLVLLLLLVSLR